MENARGRRSAARRGVCRRPGIADRQGPGAGSVRSGVTTAHRCSGAGQQGGPGFATDLVSSASRSARVPVRRQRPGPPPATVPEARRPLAVGRHPGGRRTAFVASSRIGRNRRIGMERRSRPARCREPDGVPWPLAVGARPDADLLDRQAGAP